MITLSPLEPSALSSILHAAVLGKLGKLGNINVIDNIAYKNSKISMQPSESIRENQKSITINNNYILKNLF